MMFKTRPWLLLVWLIFLVFSGCVEQTKASRPAAQSATTSSNEDKTGDASEKISEAPSQPIASADPIAVDVANAKPERNDATTSAEPNATEAATSEKPKEGKEPELEKKKDVVATQASQTTFHEAAYLSPETIGIVVSHPNKFVDAPLGKVLKNFDLHLQVPVVGEFIRASKLDPAQIQRMTVGFDQSLVNAFARESGLKLPEEPAGAANEISQAKRSLKEIGLAFHNYHDTFARFPRSDGNAEGNRTGLSWRVHLLPFVGQAALYNQFDLSEPWDSNRNKALIEKMPDVYKSPGVTEAGKTSFQVFTGEKTLFEGEQGPAILEITDGTSNTILTILAGSDRAEFWTKPGGLDVDLSAPKKSIGDVKDDFYLAVMSDGRVIDLPTNTDDTTLAYLIQPRDGHPTKFETSRLKQQGSILPLIIFSFTINADRDQIVRSAVPDAVEEKHQGQSFRHNKTLAVWFPDDRTLVTGSMVSVKRAIETKLSNHTEKSQLVDQLRLSADLTAAIDVGSQAALFAKVVQKYPMLLPINNVKIITAGISASGQEASPFLEVIAHALDAQVAAGLLAISKDALSRAQTVINQYSLPVSANASDKEMNEIVKQLVSSAVLKTDGDTVQFQIPTFQKSERVSVLLNATLASIQSAGQADKQTPEEK